MPGPANDFRWHDWPAHPATPPINTRGSPATTRADDTASQFAPVELPVCHSVRTIRLAGLRVLDLSLGSGRRRSGL